MADTLTDNQTYEAASLEADLVMKGGITSGIVYPHAACELARRYRFRNVGGTSAGAIAAAATAAAEHGREQGHEDRDEERGFARLHRIPDELAATDGGHETLLQGLFQPDPETRSLFELATISMQRGTAAKVWTALRAFWRRGWPTIVISIVLAVVFAILLSPWAAGYPLLVGFVAALIGVARSVKSEAARTLPANYFGLCRLGPGEGTNSHVPPLTVWLHKTIQALAGRSNGEKPLTFADLWRTDQEPRRPVSEYECDPKLRRINLEMIATDLAHGRPLRLPIARDEHQDRLVDGGDRLVINLNEFRRLFPEEVVEHLRRSAPTPDRTSLELLRRAAPEGEFRHLPSAELPVVVAARMSLAFPVLIAAVPLWRLPAASPPAASDLVERVLISDGGITSNFPVHFFDSPLPRRPTFALDLTGFLEQDPGRAAEPGEYLQGPESPLATLPWEPFTRVASLRDFFVAIKDAMQNWRDNAQARLPGFRERVVHIHVGQGEGGLNLAMDEKQIESLSSRGGAAGESLVTSFSGEADGPVKRTEHWNGTRFARYRIAMQGTEHHLRLFETGWSEPADPAAIPYSERVADGLTTAPYPFAERELLDLAEATTKRYLDLVAEWEKSGRTLSDRNSPRPPAVLQAAPRA